MVFGSLGFAGVLMVVLVVSQVTWFSSGGGRISAGLEVDSRVDGSRAVTTRVIGPADARAAQADLSLPTNSTSPATPG